MNLNELIPVNISEKILKHTTRKDRIQISSGSFTTTDAMLKGILYREKNLTEKHLPAFTELIKVAIKNASSATADVELLQSVIKNS